MKWWAQSRLRSKIFLAFSALILLSLLLTLWLTQFVVSRQVQATLRAQMLTTGQVFQGLVSERAARLLANTKLLASDFALKQAMATIKDPSTLISVALNYQQRIAVDLLWMTDATGTLLADVLGTHKQGESVAQVSPLAEALTAGEAAAAIAEHDGALFQLVAVPVFAPDVIGFLVLGEGIDDPLARQLMDDTGSQVSFLTRERLFASSWSQTGRTPLQSPDRDLAQILQHPPSATFLLSHGTERFLSILVPIESRLSVPLSALVQRSYDTALVPLHALQQRIIAISGGALLVALFLGVGLAGGITAPIQTLVAGMQEVRTGNLGHRLGIERQDEIGFLARSFNDMAGGLEEREQIRDVINKVVSPEIARELLQHGVALGGEVRTITVLFADIRGFTSLSEQLPPSELVGLLNAYLGRISRVIESEKGVIDKYIGDEVMAIFGAPLLLPDHAVRAVTAATRMLEALKDFNAAEGRAHPLRIGIGIASGPVIAGNVGSPERLNYTVLGDTVNIASRLQGLTKEYSVPLIMTGTTYEQVQATFPCRLLGTVAVRGRQQETALYTIEVKQG